MALQDPVSVGTTITPVLPARPRLGYLLAVESGGPVAFQFGEDNPSKPLTYARGVKFGTGEKWLCMDPAIASRGVKSIVASGTATVSVEEFA